MAGNFFIWCEKNAAVILAFCWLIVQCCIFYFTGIVSNGEAVKYTGQAFHLVHDHRIDEARYIFYIIPILLLSLIQLLHLPLNIFILFQIILNGISTIAFYKTSEFLFQNKAAAFFSTLVFITFIPYQYWNFFVYTDSIFYSLSLLLFYAVIVLNDKKRSSFFIQIILLIALLFTRPLGILYIPALIIFNLFKREIKFWIKIFCCAIMLLIIFFSINFLYKGGGDMNILFPQTEGYVICFQHSLILPNAASIKVSGNPVKDIFTYILQNPLRFFQLAFLRLISFFNLCRPYYSPLHNIYLAVNMLALYSAAIFSFIKFSVFKTKASKKFFLVLFIIFIVAVMLQCDDYNSRFVMPLFPVIIFFAVDFWNKVFNKKLN